MTRRDQEAETTEVVDDPQQIGLDEAIEDAPAPVEQPDEEDAPAPLTVDQLALMIADLDETQQREFVQALDVLIDVDHGTERPSREGIKAGDYVELDGHAYVRFPDGSVVTASRQLLVGQPGEYFVSYWGEGQGEETFTVAEKDA